MSDEIETISWVNDLAELVEVDVPRPALGRLANGASVTGRGWPERRFAEKDAKARLRAEIDQLEARRDELIDAYPQLKSRRSRR
jgi:hypothetical protein